MESKQPTQINTSVKKTPSMVVQACDDSNWPPYVIIDKNNQNELTGFSVEVVRAALATQNIGVNIKDMPWLRCQAALETEREIKMLLGASFSTEREKRFLLSAPYHLARSHMLYLHDQWPNGLSIEKPGDLHRDWTCAMRGMPVENFKLRLSDVDDGHDTLAQLAGKLRLGRCKVVLLQDEMWANFMAQEALKRVKAQIRHAPMPWAKGNSFHAMFKRNDETAKAALDALNAGLAVIEQDGTLAKLRVRWGLAPLTEPLLRKAE